MNLRHSLARYPLLAFFGLVYLLTWGSILLIAGTYVSSATTDPTTQVALVAVPMLLAPGLVGLAVTALSEGRAGLGAMLARMTHWRVNGGWYAAALVAMPLLVLAILSGLVLLVAPAYAPALSLLGLSGLVAGFLEEIGWTGFAVPRLLSRWGWLRSGLVLGVLWGLWHAVADYAIRGETLAGFWPIAFALFVLPLTAWRVLMVWVYHHTQSGPVAQLMHFSYTGSLALFIPLAALSPAQDALIYAVLTVILGCLVTIIFIRERRARRVPQPLPPQTGQLHGA